MKSVMSKKGLAALSCKNKEKNFCTWKILMDWKYHLLCNSCNNNEIDKLRIAKKDFTNEKLSKIIDYEK